MPGGTGGADHRGSAGDGQLHGEQPDTAGRAVDQDGVRCPHTGIRQQVPGGAADEQQAGGLFEGQRAGLVADVLGVDEHPLGVAAAHTRGHHLVANRQRAGEAGGSGTRSRHDAGDLQADRHGQGGGIAPHLAAVELVVDRIGARRADVDEYLIGARRGTRRPVERQALPAAVTGGNHDLGHDHNTSALLAQELVQRFGQLR